MNDTDLEIFESTGNWLKKELSTILDKIKTNGKDSMTEADFLKLNELRGRISHWNKDLDKMLT